MEKVKKYRNIISAFISSEKGQRFFNFAYSIGAAIVIWGALFKILHLPGGNTLLSVGMGTEVLMFVLTAFDRPPKEYKWEDVFPVLESHDDEDRPDFNGGSGIVISGGTTTGRKVSEAEAKAAVGLPQGIELSDDDSRSLTESIAKMAAASDQLARMAELTEATQRYLDQMAGIAAEMEHLKTTTAALN
ncbi:MAG: gliding motility protein GldL, partial [Muribaculaceae bacterium]